MNLPDYSALFRRDKVRPLRFRARCDPNFVHDVQFLCSYLHDARFLPEAVTRRGKKVAIVLERDCWELGYTEGGGALDMHVAKSRLTISPVVSVRWEAADLERLQRELWIESIYVGAAHWETPEFSEIVISAPHDGWKLRISVAADFPDTRLDDLETPYLHSARLGAVGVSAAEFGQEASG
ncbi:MAG: hypothetical protein WD069_14755 [Planctomycetales bacterium]